MTELYKPLKVELLRVGGLWESMTAMRLPKGSRSDSFTNIDTLQTTVGPKDARLASSLIKSGDEHAKAMRGVVAWIRVEMGIGWMIHLDTYDIGVEVLSTSSTMHNELKGLRGAELAEEKQRGAGEKVYVRIFTASYQALRRIYFQRRNHRHPDWPIFCRFIETLPYFDVLIAPSRMTWIYCAGGRLPEHGETVQASWVNATNERIVADSWIHPTSGEWECGAPGILPSFGWRVYAWRELPTVEAPPLREVSE